MRGRILGAYAGSPTYGRVVFRVADPRLGALIERGRWTKEGPLCLTFRAAHQTFEVHDRFGWAGAPSQLPASPIAPKRIFILPMTDAKRTRFPCRKCEDGSGAVICPGCGSHRCQQHLLRKVKERSVSKQRTESFWAQGPLIDVAFGHGGVPGGPRWDIPIYGPDELRTRQVTVRTPVLDVTTHDGQSTDLPLPEALGEPKFSDRGQQAAIDAWKAPGDRCVRCREESGELAGRRAMDTEEREQRLAAARAANRAAEQRHQSAEPDEPSWRRPVPESERDVNHYVWAFAFYALVGAGTVAAVMALGHWFTTPTELSHGPLGNENGPYFQILFAVGGLAGALGLLLPSIGAHLRERRAVRLFSGRHQEWRRSHAQWATELAALRRRHAAEEQALGAKGRSDAGKKAEDEGQTGPSASGSTERASTEPMRLPKVGWNVGRIVVAIVLLVATLVGSSAFVPSDEAAGDPLLTDKRRVLKGTGYRYKVPKGRRWSVSTQQFEAGSLRRIRGPSGLRIVVDRRNEQEPAVARDTAFENPAGLAVEEVAERLAIPGCRNRACQGFVLSDAAFGTLTIWANDRKGPAARLAREIAQSVTAL